MGKEPKRQGSAGERLGAPWPGGPGARLPNPANGKPVRQVGFVLLPHFNAMATFAAIDPLRAANYLSAQKVYDWTLVSPARARRTDTSFSSRSAARSP